MRQSWKEHTAVKIGFCFPSVGSKKIEICRPSWNVLGLFVNQGINIHVRVLVLST